jgi:uncharacterized repeat protein (TIGR03987 family)
MTLALASYSYGVWAERLLRDLMPHHVVAFWVGLAFDAVGTERMIGLARSGMRSGAGHYAFGVAAFALMFAHAAWATWVAARGTAELRRGFHRYSLGVWLLWLVPYLGGMIAGMTSGGPP